MSEGSKKDKKEGLSRTKIAALFLALAILLVAAFFLFNRDDSTDDSQGSDESSILSDDPELAEIVENASVAQSQEDYNQQLTSKTEEYASFSGDDPYEEAKLAGEVAQFRISEQKFDEAEQIIKDMKSLLTEITDQAQNEEILQLIKIAEDELALFKAEAGDTGL